VLIGRNLAVTCAHVLTEAEDKPDQPFHLHFPRLEFSTQSARVVAWSCYDQDNTKGSDIAILCFEDVAPDGVWLSMEANRPPTGADVVAIEYANGRPDGDPREAKVHYGGGDAISLAGEFVIDPGMSGTGLFYREPGERLLGLMASRPMGASQTEAYVIPADEILKLQASACEGSVQNTALPMFDGLAACFLAQASDNFRPYLEEFVAAARDVMEKPPEDWTEADINDLLSLYVQIVDQGDPGGTPLPSGLAQALAKLSDLMSEMAADARPIAESMPLEDAMKDALSSAQGEIEAFHASDACPKQAKQPTRTLLREIGCSLASKKLYPRKLSDSNELVQGMAGEAYRQLGRGVPSILGMRPDLLPAGTIFTDSVEAWAPEMVVVPAGRFLMGSPDDEVNRYDDEGPQHEVAIETRFALARFALTFDEYDAFCAATERDMPGDEDWGRDRHPVINVSWEDAKDWCAWMAERARAAYRLPSEAEWEYACRAGTTTRYWMGDDIAPEDANLDGSGHARTVPVDHPEYRRNPFDLWQMHGNVWEWCEDDFEDNYQTPRTQYPFWSYYSENLRSAYRIWVVPDSRNRDIGFRPARTLLPLSP